ncbi:MAG TPA: hypothetical protein VEF53_19750 [Patescibacteria group bacterium]|nr:hypothetical protein [Patescibacteria group bacterium]
MDKQFRRPLATLSVYGISFLHRQNPLMVSWWSIVFPGFGHYMLNQYVRATLFTLSELVINTLSHVNEAIMYTFCGKFEMAKSAIQTRWIFGYLAIFFYAIWDSYRSTIVQNKMCELAELENEPLKSNIIHPLEIQYLEQKSPYTAAVYSFFFPGLGQVYNHRFGLAFYAMFWWWVYTTLSHAYEALFFFLMGDIGQSISILRPHWLLFMPSVIGGFIYHAFITAVEHNRLYKVEQKQHLVKRYGNSDVCIFH